MLFIAFKHKNSKKYNEIIGELEIKDKNSIEKNNIIADCINKDIYQLLKEVNFNFYEIEQDIILHNCKIKIYNKTLLKKSEEKKMENSIFPNINHERNELLNVNTLSNDLTKMVEMQCQFTKLFLRDIKSKIDNNNNISTTRVFERNNNKKQENPNNILDNHGKNNNNNNDIKINDNKFNEGVTMLMVNKTKSINNNQNIRNKQAENLAQNNNQQIISQNHNNNNFITKIYHKITRIMQIIAITKINFKILIMHFKIICLCIIINKLINLIKKMLKIICFNRIIY
jgi:hypothetical protein